jgi:hypothetical protein
MTFTQRMSTCGNILHVKTSDLMSPINMVRGVLNVESELRLDGLLIWKHFE